VTCRELIQFLDDYTDGNLPVDQRRRFEEHLALCPQCVRYLDSYRKTIRVSKEAAGAEAELSERLVQAILSARQEQ
jgi:anti-sigma factor RsiW